MKKNYEIIKKARDIVASRWRKHSMGSDGEPRCALGAIAEATGRNILFVSSREQPEQDKAFQAVKKILNKTVVSLGAKDGNGNSFSSIMSYNDSYDSKQEDIVNVFSVALRKSR